MREILFRGKTKEGDWIEGYLVQGIYEFDNSPAIMIIPPNALFGADYGISNMIEVIPETVGRLIENPCYDTAYNDQRFFEGDIIGVYCSKTADIYHDEPDRVAIVIDEHCITENGLGRCFPQDTISVKVIGNVHDNPELVGEKWAERYKKYFGFSFE